MLPFDRLQKNNTFENLWIYILILLKEKNLYGYEIPALIKERFNFMPGKITPYRVLYRLEAQGFVKSKSKERKRVYCLTKKGKAEIERAKDFYKNLFKLF